MEFRVGPLVVLVSGVVSILVAASCLISEACQFISASDDASYLVGVALLVATTCVAILSLYKLPYSWAISLPKDEQDA